MKMLMLAIVLMTIFVERVRELNELRGQQAVILSDLFEVRQKSITDFSGILNLRGGAMCNCTKILHVHAASFQLSFVCVSTSHV
jgi:hypothetical protein